MSGQVKTISGNLLALERHLLYIRAFIDTDERTAAAAGKNIFEPMDFKESVGLEKTVESAARMLAVCAGAAERLSALVEKLRASI